MYFRQIRRVNAVLLATFLAIAPSIASAAPRHRDKPQNPGERIVQIIKQIRNFFTPSVSEDGVIPPKPSGP
jgi:hypothetical protein